MNTCPNNPDPAQKIEKLVTLIAFEESVSEKEVLQEFAEPSVLEVPKRIRGQYFDWRNYVPDAVVDLWPSLTLDARLAICFMAGQWQRHDPGPGDDGPTFPPYGPCLRSEALNVQDRTLDGSSHP